jgi:hypothetical protein
MTTVTRLVDSAAAAYQSLREVNAAIDASKDPGEIVRRIAIAEANIGDVLEAISDARPLVGGAAGSELAERDCDLRHLLRALGTRKAALAALQETRH